MTPPEDEIHTGTNASSAIQYVLLTFIESFVYTFATSKLNRVERWPPQRIIELRAM